LENCHNQKKIVEFLKENANQKFNARKIVGSIDVALRADKSSSGS